VNSCGTALLYPGTHLGSLHAIGLQGSSRRYWTVVSFDCSSQPRSQHWWSFDQVQQVALAHQPLQLHEALSSRSSLSSRSIQCQTPGSPVWLKALI
jgi:hypothetical protein